MKRLFGKLEDGRNVEAVTLTYHYHKRVNLATPPSATAA